MQQIQMIPIGYAHSHPGNAEKNDDAVDKAAETIRQFGWRQPMVMDKNNTI